MMHGGRGHFWPVAALISLGLLTLTTVKLVRTVEMLEGTAAELRAARIAARRSTIATIGLRYLYNQVVRGGASPTLPPGDAQGAERALLYYAVQPDCPACAINAVVLNRLESEFPGHVIGISFQPGSVTRRFVDSVGFTFQVIAATDGQEYRKVPMGVSPFAALFLGDSLLAVFTETITSDEMTEIRRAFMRNTVRSARGPRGVRDGGVAG